MLEIVKEKAPIDSLQLIYLKGSLDVYSSIDFDRFFENFIDLGNHFFLIHASQLESIVGNGICSVLRLCERVEKIDGCFAFISMPAETQMLFSFLDLKKTVRFFPNLNNALSFFQDLPAFQVKRKSDSVPVVESEAIDNDNSHFSKQQSSESSVGDIHCSYCGLQLEDVNFTNIPEPYVCPGCGQPLK